MTRTQRLHHIDGSLIFDGFEEDGAGGPVLEFDLVQQPRAAAVESIRAYG
jgi:hypothetical protein